MSRLRVLGRAALPASAALTLAALLAGGAAATPPTPANGAIWETGRLEYRWAAGMEPPSWLKPAIHAAAVDASVSTRAATPDFAYDSAAAGWIGYTGDIPSGFAVGYATRSVPHSFSIRLRPQGYQLDWGTLRWCEFYETPPTGCYDAEMITLHEFGHVLTLSHVDESTVTDWADSVMHAAPKTRAKAGWNAHEYGRCDVARLQLRYDTASSTAPISTCLSLGTQLTLGASPGTQVEYGSSFVLTATLRVDPNAAEQVLAGNVLDGRAVRLQRRPVGATGWSDVGSLTGSGAGKYSKTLSATASYEYRARFDGPGAEGLEESNSGVVRISIADPCVTSAGGTITAPTC